MSKRRPKPHEPRRLHNPGQQTKYKWQKNQKAIYLVVRSGWGFFTDTGGEKGKWCNEKMI